jgi:hypothetical protein
MILSPKAGGVGLTITAANHVIHLSRWWNPAVEDQATDRVYRIGQTRPVKVHIPMAVHPDENIGPSSFDVRLNTLMEGKRALSQGLLAPPESATDIDYMLSAVLDGTPDPATSSQATETKETLLDKAEDLPSPYPSRVQSKPNDESDRPTLTTRPSQAANKKSPIEAAEARARSIQRVVFEAGKPRDWQIFKQYLEGRVVDRLKIIDPYCCANDRVRRHLIDFVARFVQYSDGVYSVNITSYDADSVDSEDSDFSQLKDLEDRVANRLPQLDLQVSQRSRRASRLHDRSVTASFSNGDKAIWDLGGGIEALMTARFDCVVNAIEETELDGI